MNSVSRFMRPGWVVGHLLVVTAALVCMRLAWWQLDRSEESTGTIQNTGYAILWPAFGVAFIYMWVKFIRLETERSDLEDQEHQQSLALVLAEAESLTVGAAGASGATGAAVGSATSGSGPGGSVGHAGTMDEAVDDHSLAVDQADADFVGVVGDEDDDDDELNAYNRALAALADKERRAG